MLSRRKFLTITGVMFVLFFMFQFSNVTKEKWNDYGTNEYEKTQKQGTEKKDTLHTDEQKKRDLIVYIGDIEGTNVGRVVAEWASYTKREIAHYMSLSDCKADTQDLPEAVLLDSNYLDLKGDVQTLLEMTEKGTNLIFCNLPETAVIEQESGLQELLGITQIKTESTQIEGVHLFEGFLLGGSMQYYATTKKEKKKQDLELNEPWYVTHSGTKHYMVGMKEDTEVDNEELPSLIWRSSVRKSKIFAVNGDYMEDSTGLGILTAFMSELHDYE
ncbi:MAG: DUF2194 domain-containing protein, partial [Lachnospiraceae bacterium]|nr:DUF2194 domain-containing protein [Lachnospiraceae bacterium]